MKRRKIMGALGACALLCAPASAGDVLGFGTAACDELVANWNQAETDMRDVAVIAIGQWVFGYFSGRNAEAPVAQMRELGGLDNNEIALFILQQCAAFPSLRVFQIADVIYETMPFVDASA